MITMVTGEDTAVATAVPLIKEVGGGGEVGPAFHASGTPGGGPGMRGMHHAQPTQPPTPPTSQDLKQQQTHLPPQAHQLPPQPSGPMMGYNMTSAGRNSNQQPQAFYQRVQPSQQRVAHSRSPMVMNNNQPFMPPTGLVQPVYPQPVQVQGQQQIFVSPNMNHPFAPVHQGQQRGNFYAQPQFITLQQPHMMYPTSQGVYYSPQPIPQLPRTGSSGPVPSSQGAAPPQPQPGSVTVVTGPGGMVQPTVPPPAKQSRQKKPLQILDPNTGRDVIQDMLHTGNTPPRSGESSARQTPQPNSGENPDRAAVAADFAKRVAIAAGGGSPNSHSLQQPSSRTSNYSENDSQASPDPQGASPSKIDSSVETLPSESQIVENNIPYDANQQAMLRGWPSEIVSTGMPVHVLGPMPMHPGMMMNADDLMRGPPPNQPPREYQTVPTPWMTADGPMTVPVIISEKPPGQVDAPVRPARERETPVVSALAHGPTVDIPPRPRDHFPALKGHQQQSPVKRKQRSEITQEQAESKAKEQQQQQQSQPPVLQQQSQSQPQSQPQLQQQPQQQPSKVMSQPKPKQVTPINESKKQSTPPSQDCDEYVQSIQTKNNEQKTIVIKKNDSDSSETKSKPSDILTNKENNNLETRNLNEEIVQENNNRNKSDNIKCEAPVSKESSPIPLTESTSSKSDTTEEVQEESSSASATATEDVPATLEDNSPSKTNGETISEDAKSSNQKSKNNNKRQPQPAQQPNMRLDKKETRNAEVKAPVSDVTPAPALPTPETKIPPTVVVNCEQPAADDESKTKNEAVTDEDKEKEKEDLMVAAKNEENNKQTASMKTNDLTHAQVIENVNKVGQPVLKHNYKDGQWSPINLEGKKKYDRDFIMELMHDPQSKQKPQNLPDLRDLVRDNQRQPDKNFINSMSRGHGDSLMPNFANKNSSQRGPGQPGIAKRLSQQGKQKQTKPPVIHMSLSLHQDVKLHESENAWKPARVTDHNNMTDEEAKTDALYKRVRGVLNKLTPQKFGKLVEQVRALPIDNLARLQGVIDLVFKKAIDEPSFSVAYAQMCKTLHKMWVPSGQLDQDGNPVGVNFRKLLIDKCQHEFEKNTAAELKRDERLKEIQAETDPEKKKQLQLAYEEEERRIRMKSVGNIRFIGELYKLNMLTAKIMHSCVNHLLNEGDEESLECLCKLLTTIGQNLEKAAVDGKKEAEAHLDEVKYLKPDQNRRKDEVDAIKENAVKRLKEADFQLREFNNCFTKLDKIVKHKGSGKVSSRVRFMIQDLIDLRNNKWVPRRDDSNPKTIDQIQKEAERETLEMNLALNSPQERKRQDPRNMLDNKRRGGPDSGGWTTVATPNRSKFNIEASKLKISQNEVEATTLSLGNRSQYIWGQGAAGAKQDEKRPSPQLVGTNMFAALDEKVSEPSSRSSSLKGTSSLTEKDKMISSYKSNVEEEARSSRSGSQQGPGSRSSSRDSQSSLRRDERRYITPAAKAPAPTPSSIVPPSDLPPKEPLTPEVLEKKAKLLLDEYLSIRDLNEATLCLKDTFDETNLKDFIINIYYLAFEERGIPPKRAVGELMTHFIANNDISKEQFFDGLSGVLETLEDLQVDVPMVWDYLAESLVFMVSAEVISLRDVAQAFIPFKGSQGAAKFLRSLFKLLIDTKGKSWLEQKWMISNIQLGDLIKSDEVENFVKQNGLEFLFSAKVLTLETIKNEISRMIQAKASFDSITAWIDENVGPERSQKPEFVRTLVTAILEASVIKQQQSFKLDEILLGQCDMLLRRYIEHKEETELPCLYAVQTFIHKLEHPQGILHAIFDFLWDHEIISTDSFKVWRDSTDPHEWEGHAVCAKSLTSFFTLLDENETDEETKS